jgi:phosphatidylglycerophosphate synthase/putative flippase GtrA
VVDLIVGRLSAMERIWTAGAPALVLLAYVAVGLVVYWIRNALRGPWRDKEAEDRVGGGLTGRPIRVFFTWLMRPWVNTLVRLEVSPNAITSLSLALSLAAGVALAMGRFALGGWLYVGAGLCDFFDGSVARRSGRATRGGAVLDSVLDRYIESAVLVGLAWFYRDRWVLVPVLAALTGSLLVPYVRARGEAIGAKLSDVGFMQRPERVIILGATVSLSPILEVLIAPDDPRPIHRLAVVGIVLIALGTHVTAASRTKYLLRALAPTSPPPSGRRGVLWRPVLAGIVGIACELGVLWLVLQATSAPAATMVAHLAGAVVTFVVLSAWPHAPAPEGSRGPKSWLFAAGSSAVLCGGGVAVLGLVPALGLTLSWIAVRVIVLLAWTRPLLGEQIRAYLGLLDSPRGSAS